MEAGIQPTVRHTLADYVAGKRGMNVFDRACRIYSRHITSRLKIT